MFMDHELKATAKRAAEKVYYTYFGEHFGLKSKVSKNILMNVIWSVEHSYSGEIYAAADDNYEYLVVVEGGKISIKEANKNPEFNHKIELYPKDLRQLADQLRELYED